VKRSLWLLRYALPYRRGWALIVVVTLLSTAFGLLTPWPMKILVDHVLGQEAMPAELARLIALLPGGGSPEGLLAWVALAGLAIFALNSAIEVVLTWSWIVVGQRMVFDLASDLFARIQRRSLLFHSRNSVGDLISRVSGDSWALHDLVDTLLFAPAHGLVTAAAMLWVMASLDLGLTLVALAAAPLMAASSAIFGRPIRRTARAQREVEALIHSHVQRTLSGIQVVQAFAQEEHEQRRFRAFADTAVAAKQRATLAGSLFGLGSGLLSTLGTAAILWIGARHVLDGSLTVGSLLVFLAYHRALQSQLKAFTGMYGALQKAGASLDRVLEVLDTQGDVADRPGARPLPAARGHLRFEQVTFGYQPDRPVLHDLCLEVLPGQTVAIVGPTGAGKSTLVGLVPRFFDPWRGRVCLDGHDLRDLQLRSLRQQVALVLQEPFLFPLSIADNIAYGRPEATRAEVEAAARAANAHPFISRLPDGYDTLVGERGATLSGGERQRLSIARALLKDAPILILDEPTSALDAETEGLLLEALERLMAGRTTLIIAHRLSTIRNADLIVALQDGRLVEAGAHADLLAQGGLYARLHQLQTSTGPRPEALSAAG
jgi:ATP-binding cassette subfamily B protein/subfamily B ATP-binding cassette protein MsbA